MQLPQYINDYRYPNISSRLPYLDTLKGISMILVMLSHTAIPNGIAIIFKPFFLSVFFVVSGYTFNIKRNFREFIINKIKTLLFPAFSLGLIQIILSYILTFSEQDSFGNQILELLLQNGGQGSKMWFVFALFIFSLVFYFIVKHLKRTISVIIIALCGCAICLFYNYNIGISFPWYINLIGLGCFWMTIGYLWRIFSQYNSQNSEKVDKLEWFGLIFNFAIYLTIIVIHIYRWNDIYVSFRVFSSPIWLYIIESIAGTVSICLLLKRLPTYKIFAFIGQNTLVYFAFHGKVQRIIEVGCQKIHIEGFIEVLLILLMQCITLAFASIIINRYFPFLVGKKIKRKEKRE